MMWDRLMMANDGLIMATAPVNIGKNEQQKPVAEKVNPFSQSGGIPKSLAPLPTMMMMCVCVWNGLRVPKLSGKNPRAHVPGTCTFSPPSSKPTLYTKIKLSTPQREHHMHNKLENQRITKKVLYFLKIKITPEAPREHEIYEQRSFDQSLAEATIECHSELTDLLDKSHH